VATGFGRTGAMFACEHDRVQPDILCLAKGITAGYLPLAATLCTDEIEDAFTGDLEAKRTLYHGHTYTGNALACTAAMASLDLFEQNDVIEHSRALSRQISDRLDVLRDHPNVLDIRQRGLMVGIELCRNRDTAEPFDFSRRTAYALCDRMRERGLIIRPLGDIVILMPPPAMSGKLLNEMLDVVVDTLRNWRFE
ncbi:MAG: aminotransferase class III-fold pyridoxal phosphate-dependent enzyme, partial [Rhodospirillales bacterium]|nr:aminotransferase class III-fold pyridoxal phosphate-dependent enzyme [Rhodospirillales bacterium]